MARIICTVDHTPHFAEAVRVAVERCQNGGDELRLVGVVEPFTSAVAPAYGERVRRFGLVETNLVHASRAAKSAGVTPTIERRYGHLQSEAVAAADEFGADEIVLAEPRGLFRTGADVVTVSRPRTERKPLALVA